jgi:hypothetical protein
MDGRERKVWCWFARFDGCSNHGPHASSGWFTSSVVVARELLARIQCMPVEIERKRFYRATGEANGRAIAPSSIGTL